MEKELDPLLRVYQEEAPGPAFPRLEPQQDGIPGRVSPRLAHPPEEKGDQQAATNKQVGPMFLVTGSLEPGLGDVSQQGAAYLEEELIALLIIETFLKLPLFLSQKKNICKASLPEQGRDLRRSTENQRRWDPECEGGELGLLWYSQASSMMASLESQAQASRSHDDPPVSISYCQSLGEGQFVHWKKEVLNGQELVVLTVRNGCPSPSVEGNLWESLETWGIRMTPDQWQILIQCAVLGPEVRKYMFYNSRAFGILITVVVYMTLWVNLYSTLETFSLARYWGCSILVTGVALLTALAIRLLIHWQQQKLNVNTDMRLAAANEVFMKNEFLVGITETFEKHQSIRQLWFVRVDVKPCHRSLADALTELENSSQAALRPKLKKLHIVIERPILPSPDEEAASSPLEEVPLLHQPESSGLPPLAHRERLQLVPDGTPEVVAHELLVIFSSYYIRLLVSGQLLEVPAKRHVSHGPCLCQFIETTVLEKKCSQPR